jgi:hypothetical protein
LLQSTKPTVSTNILTNYSPSLEGNEESNGHISETITNMKSTVQHTSTVSPNELELTHQETTSEQIELGRTTLLITDYRASETFNELSESTATSSGVLKTSTGTPIEIESATSTVSARETATSVPSSTVSNGLLESESTVTSESEAITTEQVFASEPEATIPNSPDIPDFNDASSSTECSTFPFTIPPTSHYHCIGSGRFPARPSCTEYHVCRLEGFWFVHFKQTCHFGLHFSLRLRFCVPSYLSDCEIDPYLTDYNRKDGVHSENNRSSSEYDDDSAEGRIGEVSRRNLWFPLMKKRRAMY